jgi:ketosteroid isomerase-like protein
MASADETAIADWFAAWDKLVDGVDFVPARELFDPGVIGFGPRMDTVKGLDLLERDQWRRVWPTIDGFEFDLSTLECLVSPDRLQAVGIVVWSSTGYGEGGTPFDRPGRATVVFRRANAADPWKAIHTHISLNPGTPQRSHGDRPAAS